MPKLYLLRHAQADMAYGMEDKNRPLTPHGITQATLVAAHLKDINVVYCSAAERTKMTLQAAIDGGAEIKRHEIIDNFYNAPAEILRQKILDSDAENILIIAHNPGIHQLAASLTMTGEEQKLNQLMSMYPPASLSIFDCDIEAWSDLKSYQNTLIDFIIQP